jgi:hypothetical protein
MHPYPSPEARDAQTRQTAADLGGQVVQYGESVQGRPLLALRLPGDGPAVLVCANIHGIEYISAQVALRFARIAALPAEVWVVPCVNPDGYAATWAAAGAGRLGALRKNANGVDLNRNFPMPWGAKPSWLPGAGSTNPQDATWRGPAPASEPEVAALIDLMRRIDPWAGANLHSFMGTLIPPRVLHLADHRAYASLAAALRAGQTAARYPRLCFPPLDVFTGEQEDFQHHILGTWALCVETFTLPASLRQRRRRAGLFWRFNPIDPEPWVASDAAGVAAFLSAALRRPRPPRRQGAGTGLLAGVQ